MYKAVIFDFFDVIHRDPFEHWLRQNGLERSGAIHESSELLDLGKINDEEFYQRLSDLSGRPVQAIKAVFSNTDFIDHEVVSLIKRLKKSYKTGLLSNCSIEYIWSIIERHDLESWFDAVTVSAEIGIIKPDPRIFEHILNKLGVTPGEAVFIDDNPRNVKAAAGLGIRSIVYKDRSSLEHELAAAGLDI